MDVATARRTAPLVFGAVVAVTVFLAPGALVTVAVVGGILLGLLYALTGGIPGPASWRERDRRRRGERRDRRR